jgi:hypothetical protein
LHQELSRTEALAALWCIENLVPAEQANSNRYGVVFYEELLERPEFEWLRIAEVLGTTGVPEADLRMQPSQQSAVRLQKRDGIDDSYSESYASWRKRLSPADLHQIARVLEAFNVQFYSVSESRPNLKLFTRQFLSN